MEKPSKVPAGGPPSSPVPAGMSWLPTVVLDPAGSFLATLRWGLRCLSATARQLRTSKPTLGAYAAVTLVALWAALSDTTRVLYAAWGALALFPLLTAATSLAQARAPKAPDGTRAWKLPWLRLVPALLLVAAVGGAAAYLAMLAMVAAAVCAATYLALVVAGRVTGLWSGRLWSRSAVRVAPGEVWIVEVPNDNPAEPSAVKNRPAVVLRSDGDRTWVLWATSQTHRAGQRGYLEVSKLRGWPLDGKTSYLNVNSPLVVLPPALKRRVGALPAKSFTKVVQVANLP